MHRIGRKQFSNCRHRRCAVRCDAFCTAKERGNDAIYLIFCCKLPQPTVSFIVLLVNIFVYGNFKVKPKRMKSLFDVTFTFYSTFEREKKENEKNTQRE